MDENALSTEIQLLLEEQRLVLDHAFWQQHKSEDGILLDALQKALPTTPDSEREGLLALLKRVNRAVHDATARVNVASFRESLTKEFGNRCYLCGADGDSHELHIDHVLPLARSGAARDYNNLQLLCAGCNSGKSDLESQLLPRALTTNVNATPTEAIRFKRLMLTGVKGRRGRTLGRCEECSRTSQERHLIVVASDPFAANLVTTKVVCEEGCT